MFIKKTFSVFLVMAIIVLSLPLIGVPVFAADWADVLYYEPDYEGTGMMITGCDELASGNLEIPSEIDGLPVTQIGYQAFSGCSRLTSVTVANSVMFIDDWAFEYCTSLASVTIGSGTAYIGGWIFDGCGSLKNIYVNESNENYHSIDGVLFDTVNSVLLCYPAGKTASSYAVPEGIESVDGGAFYGNQSLGNVTIPDSVVNLFESAFDGCIFLESITVDADNEYYRGIDGVLFDKDVSELICYPMGKTNSEYSIPDSVSYIGSYAFEECSCLESVIIPESVTGIGWAVFGGCTSLKSVTIANGLTSIGDGMFNNCPSLENAAIPSSVTSIGSYAFSDCSSLASVDIPDSVATIGEGAFYGCISLTDVTIPDSVIRIGEGAFNDCASLNSITIPDSVTSIGYAAFIGTAYYANPDNWVNDVLYIGKYLIEASMDISETHEIKNGTVCIADYAFAYCESLKNVTIPNSVTGIGEGAFSSSSLKSVAIPDGVLSIGAGAFFDCAKLSGITIADSVKNIGYAAFSGTKYYNNGSNWQNGSLYIGKHLIEVDWRTNGNYIIKEDTVSIADYAFGECSSLNAVTIPDSVVRIGDATFCGCSSLTDVTIPNSVTSIGVCAFESCSSLTDIAIPDSVVIVADWAFLNCTSLESVIIPYSVTQIGTEAFGYCYDNEDYETRVMDNFLIYCYPDSAALDYALDNGFDYIIIGGTDFLLTPGSALEIDSVKRLLICFEDKITAEAMASQFENENIVIVKDGEQLEDGEFAGTGCEIRLMDGENILESLTVIIKGDVDGDGEVNIPDARKVLRVAVKLENFNGNPAAAYAADAVKNAKTEISDARKILRVAVGLESF